jgi:HNH endonuclease
MQYICVSWRYRSPLNALGLVAFVDDRDYAELSQYTWTAVRKRRMWYAKPRIGTRTVYMHIMVMGRREGFQVDHKNANGLDNRRANLRWSTPSQNVAKARKRRGRYTSTYKGVALYARNGRFTAQIHVQGRKYHLGYFLDPESAAQAYDAAALRYFGAYARINFPRLAKGV